MNLPILIPADANLNTYTTPGMYFCEGNGSTVQNSPVPADSFSLFVEKTGAWGTGVKQTFTHFSTGGTCQRVLGYDASDAKGPWVPLATATPPQEYDFPLSDRLHPSSRSVYSKNQFGQVHVHGAVSAGDSTIGWDQAIGTLPEGYRPSVAMEFCASFAVDGVNCAGAVSISTDGLIKAYPDVATPQKVVYFDVVFLATSK